jgi:hypothetical protein
MLIDIVQYIESLWMLEFLFNLMHFVFISILMMLFLSVFVKYVLFSKHISDHQ